MEGAGAMTHRELRARNALIHARHKGGVSFEAIAAEFKLGVPWVKIIYFSYERRLRPKP